LSWNTLERSQKRAFAAAVLALAMWSGTPVANKIAVSYMSGLTAGVLRSMLAAAIALVAALALRLPVPMGGRDRILLIASGAASFAIWPALASMGIARTTASHAAVIMAMIPILTALIAHLVDGRLPRAGWWFGAVTAFAATALLVIAANAGTASSTPSADIAGDLIVLAGCLVCAIGYVAGGKLSAKLGTTATTFWSLASALLLLIPLFGLIAKETAWTAIPVRGWLAIGWMTILSSLTGYVLWFYALGVGGIARISSLQLATPAVTIAAAALILREGITAQMAVITVVILTGTSWAHKNAR
jgi:drug/metabolite transporter (DMT)-like permease